MKQKNVHAIVRRISLLTCVSALLTVFPACAQVPKEAEENTEPAEIIELVPTPTPDIAYEPVPETPAQPFTIAGNAEIIDDIKEGSKEFYTITTKNNNQFFIVVDKARATENVYMLARVNEDDVAEFIEGYTLPTPAPTPQVIIQKPTPAPTPQVIQTEPEVKNDNTRAYALTGLGVLVFIAGAYYFKVYKPKHDEEDYADEGMEYDDSTDETDGDE